MDENNSEQKLKEICSLQLTYKGLLEFPDYLLTDDVYKALNLLYLGRNSITALPENLSNLSLLTGLFINNNKLQCLPEGISSLQCLESLNLTGNELTKLPEGLGQLKKLQKLHIGNNKLSRLPACIGKLTELRILEVTNNSLASVPIELSCCRNLKILNLDNNRLKFLPRQLRDLHRLTELSVVGNNLLVLPQEIGRSECFRTLYVDNNQCLYSVPSSLDFKNIGFIGCANIPLSSEILDAYFNVYVQHTLTSKLPILLTPDLQNVCNMQQCVPTLLELSLRVAHSNIHFLSDIEETIPNNLISFIKCSVGKCEKCKKDIFVSAFPVVFKRHTFTGYLQGMCCSIKCVKTCYQGGDLSMVYPSMEDMSLALVPIQ